MRGLCAAMICLLGCAQHRERTSERDAATQPTPDASTTDAAVSTSASSGDAGSAPECVPMPGLPPGFVEVNGFSSLCNGLDDDCDGVIDEGWDDDRDGLPDCTPPNGISQDCDNENAQVGRNKPELCDGIDNDCDGRWDEGAGDDCPTPRCSTTGKCPAELVCIDRRETCAQPGTCRDVAPTEVECDDARERWWLASICDPAACIHWIGGTCWGDCVCWGDGNYRWRVQCTE